jgi:hypothetical protein
MSKITKAKKLNLGFSIQPSIRGDLLSSNVKTVRKLNNIEKSKEKLICWLLNCNVKSKFR